MSAITEYLYPAPAKRTVGGIVRWWERRRLGYNLIVGSAGVLSVGLSWILTALPPGGELVGFIPWQPIVAFGVMANVCYSLGPAAEILIQKLFGGQVLPTGPVLYRMGLTFSVGLALFPALLMTFFWVARIVMWVIPG